MHFQNEKNHFFPKEDDQIAKFDQFEIYIMKFILFLHLNQNILGTSVVFNLILKNSKLLNEEESKMYQMII